MLYIFQGGVGSLWLTVECSGLEISLKSSGLEFSIKSSGCKTVVSLTISTDLFPLCWSNNIIVSIETKMMA